MGNVSNSVSDFGYPFETSHTKGHQDGVAANLKSKADMSVIRRKHVQFKLIRIFLILCKKYAASPTRSELEQKNLLLC